MSLGKSFRPRKTRKYSGIHQTVDCMDAGGTTPRMDKVVQRMERLPRAMQGAIAEGCHPKDELLNRHSHTDLFRVFRVFRGSIEV